MKVLSDTGSGWSDDIANGIYYARDKGAPIVSMSLGGDGFDQWMYDAIHASPNVLFVCAAGNNNFNTDYSYNFQSPADFDLPNIISVGASTSYDTRASFSNWGVSTVDLFAPGVGIYNTVPGGSYESWQGTSMATPYVSGVAALVKALVPSYTVAQIKSAILNGVDTASGFSGICVTGGRLNASQTVRSVNPLQAKFYGIPETQIFPLAVHFKDASTGNPTSWLWTFGEGNTSVEQNPVHTYTSPGSFSVTLAVQR